MNNSIMPSSNLVQLAYRLLKQDTYYNKMDMLLKKKEKKALGEFMSKCKFPEEYVRIEEILAAEKGHP